MGRYQPGGNCPLIELPNRAHTSTPTARRVQFAFYNIARTKTGLVRSNDITRSLAFDLGLGVFDSELSATQALSLCLHQSSGRGEPERMLRGQGLGRSVQSVERGGCRARTRKTRGARVHIELSRSMRHRRDGFSRTRSLFLRARYDCGRPRDCGWARHGPTGQTACDHRGSTQWS